MEFYWRTQFKSHVLMEKGIVYVTHSFKISSMLPTVPS